MPPTWESDRVQISETPSNVWLASVYVEYSLKLVEIFDYYMWFTCSYASLCSSITISQAVQNVKLNLGRTFFFWVSTQQKFLIFLPDRHLMASLKHELLGLTPDAWWKGLRGFSTGWFFDKNPQVGRHIMELPECHIFEGHWHVGRRITRSPLKLLVTNCLCVEYGC